LPYVKFFVQRRSSNKIISTHYRSCFKDNWHICIIANKTFHESSTNPEYHRKSLCNNDCRDTTVKIKQLNDGWLNTLFMVIFVYIYIYIYIYILYIYQDERSKSTDKIPALYDGIQKVTRENKYFRNLSNIRLINVYMTIFFRTSVILNFQKSTIFTVKKITLWLKLAS
jgi:hypothetical protein